MDKIIRSYVFNITGQYPDIQTLSIPQGCEIVGSGVEGTDLVIYCREDETTPPEEFEDVSFQIVELGRPVNPTAAANIAGFGTRGGTTFFVFRIS